jgi:xanthine dehydrogenase/oxidase
VQVRTCWEKAIESAGGLENRQKAVAEFNSKSRFRKRGLAVTPTKFGISFTTKFLNQVWFLRGTCTSSSHRIWMTGLEEHWHTDQTSTLDCHAGHAMPM